MYTMNAEFFTGNLAFRATSSSSGEASVPKCVGAVHVRPVGSHAGRVAHLDVLVGRTIADGSGSGSKHPSGSKSNMDAVGEWGDDGMGDIGCGVVACGSRLVSSVLVGGYSPSMTAKSVGALSSMKRTSHDVINVHVSMSSSW